MSTFIHKIHNLSNHSTMKKIINIWAKLPEGLTLDSLIYYRDTLTKLVGPIRTYDHPELVKMGENGYALIGTDYTEQKKKEMQANLEKSQSKSV